ncbi:MAG TPA: serine hydrolase domain-containing protein [Gemmataceae bacterium]|nr:serine hydrolase domain-containing protein [Gemmataceae bacterium]
MRVSSLVLSIAGIVLGACVFPVAQNCQADDRQGPQANAEINAILTPLREKYKLPALAAAVVRGKGLMAVGAVGVRKCGDDTKVTVSDEFHLGSDTKAMTATVIASLVQDGKLNWNDTLGRTFPKLAGSMTPALRKVTLTQLLTHHAGLRANVAGGWSTILRRGTTREQRQNVLEKIAEEKLEYEPDKEFHYSNLGYVLAAHMAEKAANASWEELMAKRLFEPLHMRSAGFGAMGARDKLDQPWQHTKDGKPIAPGPFSDNPPVMGPAGTVHCSLPDWARFIADQLRGARGERALLKPKTYTKLHTSPYRDQFYTLGGWAGRAEDDQAGGVALAHDGSNNRNFAVAWLAPQRDLAILVVCNQGGDDAKKACHEARKLLLQKYAKKR